MKVPVFDVHFNGGARCEINLSLAQILKLRFLGRTIIFHRAKPGWKKAEPFYVIRCHRHGLFIDYAHGHRGYFSCPRCNGKERKINE